ncbi:hypothetical protein D3C87_1534320 [compost metagenome]
MLVTATWVLPLATALAPLSITLSIALRLSPRVAPTARVPPWPTQGPVTVRTAPGARPMRLTVPLWLMPATRWS